MSAKRASRPPRPPVEQLLAFDRAVCEWIDAVGAVGPEILEVPLESSPFREWSSSGTFLASAPSSAEAGRGATPRSALRMAGLDEAGRGATPRSALRMAGLDEAGRGALAGPVTVGCASFHPSMFLGTSGAHEELMSLLQGLGDSKRVTPRNRERLFEAITSLGAWSVGCATASEIDRIGIVSACALAAFRAVRGLPVQADVFFVDRGLRVGREACSSVEEAPPRQVTMTRADTASFHVAAASIVAKVWRDRVMCRLAEVFPEYSFAGHKGYGTAAHGETIREHGPSAVHRQTFLGGLANEGNDAESQSC